MQTFQNFFTATTYRLKPYICRQLRVLVYVLGTYDYYSLKPSEFQKPISKRKVMFPDSRTPRPLNMRIQLLSATIHISDKKVSSKKKNLDQPGTENAAILS